MRIKKFIAADMNKLISQVKKELGEDAVIISSIELSDGNIELIAAIENDDISFNEKDEIEILSSSFQDTYIRECLSYHELTLAAQSKLLAHCRNIAERYRISNDKEVLEKTFDEIFEYYDFFDNISPVKMFMGIQGCGKSTIIAKVATIAKIKNISTTIISVDNVRAGTNNQLKAFANILNADFQFVKDTEYLSDKILSAKTTSQLVLIDTPGINPFIESDIARLDIISKHANCSKILVVDAGRNAYDSVEAAEIFKNIGADCILPTKLDLTRRIGSFISVVVNSNLKLGYASIGASIAKSLAKVSNKSLSDLILD